MKKTTIELDMVKDVTVMMLYNTLEMATAEEKVDLHDVVTEMHKGVNEFFNKLIAVTKRELINYHKSQGHSYEEIAKEIGMSSVEVKAIAEEVIE